MEKVKKSAFRLEQFLISESNIKRSPKKQGEIMINFSPSGIIDETKKIYQLHLEVELSDKNESFNIKIGAIGFFRFKETQRKETIDNYFYVNAPAIIFPYIRAYIASLTALTGLNVINLPLMNLSALGKTLKENTTQV